ncbi:MAG TPA: NAD(P)-dependent oxidoreductase [Gemmatimonadaceae bacterium]|nr:NAD(P)-dependent oxidoreductase [Gemmatimonadaceae bacterium]
MDILQPIDSQRIVSSLRDTRNPNVWVYRFTHPEAGWILSIATHAEPGSGKLSLGGFRIAPRERTEAPGFDPDKEAVSLAMGMEEKVHWSRVLTIGGPRARRDMRRSVGGKCVLQPTDDARVGKPRDFEMLDWALECFREMERESGIWITTGQDLGHGTMSDGKTQSLKYLGSRFHGCVTSDTSVPTGEGNYNVLKGMLAAMGIQPTGTTVGLIGVGNIGRHVLDRLRDDGATVLAVEAAPERRAALEENGVPVWDPAAKLQMLMEPMDALVVNAAAGSLDGDTISACVANPRLKIVCGSENMAMKDPEGASRLLAAKKIYCPTELGGMMGYLTAVEEYLAVKDGLRFEVRQMLEASKRLEMVGRQAASLIRSRAYSIDFEMAAEEIGQAASPV